MAPSRCRTVACAMELYGMGLIPEGTGALLSGATRRRWSRPADDRPRRGLRKKWRAPTGIEAPTDTRASMSVKKQELTAYDPRAARGSAQLCDRQLRGRARARLHHPPRCSGRGQGRQRRDRGKPTGHHLPDRRGARRLRRLPVTTFGIAPRRSPRLGLDRVEYSVPRSSVRRRIWTSSGCSTEAGRREGRRANRRIVTEPLNRASKGGSRLPR